VKDNGNGTYTLITSAKGTAEVPGLASFREFGTNPHPIKGNPLLVFPWDKASDFIPKTSDGRVILKSVNHPGSDADNNNKGYLRPAIRDGVKFIRKNVLAKGKIAIRKDIKDGFNVSIR
jgi:hypothetical protein